ncbi:MAG: Sua5/YciO/YrdC/YwlC family protein [Bacteroidetes bacterium]|nr:Sua5/YciO/YrdC/YwlC family protein [Bacteroidota bacterium]
MAVIGNSLQKSIEELTNGNIIGIPTETVYGLAANAAAPSANPFGYISPTTAQHVEAQLGEAIPYILDGGECKVGVESTIVAFEGDCVIIMRLGGTSVEDIETLIGKVELRINASSNPASPGQLLSHYSPKKIFLLGDIEKMLIENEDKKVAIISFNKKYEAENILSNKILSPNRNMHEAAKNLFHFMRLADASTVDLILAEEVPDIGLGMAINDRLRRAAFI